jgi:hypothetical protein
MGERRLILIALKLPFSCADAVTKSAFRKSEIDGRRTAGGRAAISLSSKLALRAPAKGHAVSVNEILESGE